MENIYKYLFDEGHGKTLYDPLNAVQIQFGNHQHGYGKKKNFLLIF